MKLTYKQRIFSYFFIIFALFTVSIIVFEQKEEKAQRTKALEDRLDSYAEMIHTYIEMRHLTDSDMAHIDTLAYILPEDIRISIINMDGKVTFDKDVKDISTLENHLDRPEIRNALYQNTGSNIRMSVSTKH